MYKKFYNQVKRIRIFMVYHEITKQVYIQFTTAADIKHVFSLHRSGQNRHTRELCERWKHTGDPPEFFILEDIDCTQSQAYRRVVIWIRYFIDHGYTILNSQGHINNAMNLSEKNEIEYQKIKSKLLIDVFSEQCVRDIKPKNARKQVKFFCTEEEYATIQSLAQGLNMTVSAYIRSAALTNGRIIRYNHDVIRRHTDEVLDVKRRLYPVVALLTATGQVLQKEVQHIVSCLESLVESEKKLLDDNLKEEKQVRKLVNKEIRATQKQKKDGA